MHTHTHNHIKSERGRWVCYLVFDVYIFWNFLVMFGALWFEIHLAFGLSFHGFQLQNKKKTPSKTSRIVAILHTETRLSDSGRCVHVELRTFCAGGCHAGVHHAACRLQARSPPSHNIKQAEALVWQMYCDRHGHGRCMDTLS